MPITCPECGRWTLLGDGFTRLACDPCGASIPANLVPLFLITGAAGTGKSAIIPFLRPRLPDALVVGGDFLLSEPRPQCVNRWLRIAFAEAQCGRYTVISGLIEPNELETAPDRRLVRNIETILLDCDDATREARIRARKRWAPRGPEALDFLVDQHRDLAATLPYRTRSTPQPTASNRWPNSWPVGTRT